MQLTPSQLLILRLNTFVASINVTGLGIPQHIQNPLMLKELKPKPLRAFLGSRSNA